MYSPCCYGKMSITQPLCVCACVRACARVCVCVCVVLVIQYAMHMRHFLSVAYPAVKYYSTTSHKRYDFREKKVIEYKMCVFVSSTRFV